MYTAFFGLERDPFSISPDPRFLFMSERHREALAHLLYGVRGAGGIVLLTGDIGTGKTTISRHFLAQAPALCQVAYIFNPRLNAIELLLSICDEFGVKLSRNEDRDTTVKDVLDPLNAFLLAAHAAGRNPVLIIDEAQNLSVEVLEQLRLLTNLETNERKLLQIVLIGQPELRAMLARPGLEQLSQRIVARFHLGPLDQADTSRYIAHRMDVGGASGPPPFAARALRRVFQLSGGVPRKINLLCGRALLGAYALGQHEVSCAVVQRAAAEVFDGLNAPVLGRGRRAGLLTAAALTGGILATTAVLLVQRARQTPTPNALAAPAPVAPQLAVVPSPPTVLTTPTPTPTPTPAPAPAPTAASPSPAAQTAPAKATDLLATENAGWLAIAPRWGLDASAGLPCSAAQSQGLQCYRMSRMTLHGVRQMDRPALLRLHLPGGSGFAVLEGLDGDKVVLAAGGHRWTADAASLRRIWQGEYLSLWRLPPGQQERLSNGFSGTAALWMNERLTALQQSGQLDAKARSLADKVAAFQRSVGLLVDGRASPTTMILLNRASAVEEPRLSTTSP